MIRIILSVLLLGAVITKIEAQKSRETVTRSSLLEIDLPAEAQRDNGIFSVAAAKSILEMESTSENVLISEVEILVFGNPSGVKEVAIKNMEEFKKYLQQHGFALVISVNDNAYSWITKSKSIWLLYISSTKKESSVYIGVADKLPGDQYRPQLVNQTESNESIGNESLKIDQKQIERSHKSNPELSNSSCSLLEELIGNWGTLAGAKVNWRDESTGNMLISGVSKGFGLELKADGTFLQTTVVTSGRPNYRVFVSTSGTWQVDKDQLLLYPGDRHYRKWENEIIMIDEHSVPESYGIFWRRQKNEITFKDCLYVRYTINDQEQELCKE